MKYDTSTDGVYRSTGIPEDPASQKLIGLYRQAQDGLWLQRVKVPGGRLTGAQWNTLASIARRFTPSTPLHLTTRQDVEIHDLTPEQVPQVQAELHLASLDCLGAAGDTFRNITVCPCAGTAANSVDLLPLAIEIDRTLRTLNGIYDLPRKFKITLACSETCGQPWINDLGFVASKSDGQWGFKVIGAGSLGARPETGMLLFDWLPADQVLPLVVAAVNVFAKHGDRTNRAKARLRHIRQRMGNEPFAGLMRGVFRMVLAKEKWPTPTLPASEKAFSAKATLTFVNGDVWPEAAEGLAALQSSGAARVHIASQHQVIVMGRDETILTDTLACCDALNEAAKPQPVVVTCPGTRWCSHGLVETNALADRLRAELDGRLPADATICISGCPNGCSHPAVASFGLTGCLTTSNGRKQEAFNLLAGGDMGRTGKMAEPIAPKLFPDQVVTEILRRLDSHTVNTR